MLKKRTLALLLSLAMLLTFMPAMAFAEDAADDAADQPEAVAVEEAGTEDAAVEAEADAAEEAVVEEAVVEEAAEEVAEPMEALEAEAEPVPVSIKYTGPAVTYDPMWGPDSVDLYEEGMQFDVTFDNTTKTAKCIAWGTDTNEDGETYTMKDYFFDEPVVKTDSDGYKYAENAVWFELDREKATATSIPVRYVYYVDGAEKYLEGTLPIAEKVYPKPTKIEFVSSGEFAAEGMIGDDYLYPYNFNGAGNKFVVTYDENGKSFTREYVYYESGDEDGFRTADGEDYLWAEIKLDRRLAKGTADYTGKAGIDSEYGEIWLPISFKAHAEMYKAYVEYKTYTYSGKSIKPKVVVKYFDGKKFKKMSAKWYTCKPKKYKAVGGHEFTVKIKKKYQAKYGQSLYGYWEILPKTPTIKKATAGSAGSGTMTVTWTKFSKKNQKGIDGFYIQISDSKSFVDGVREIEAKKGDAKAVITDLDPGTYYVRIVSHKAVGKGDGSPWASKPSKVKTVVIK